MEVFEVRFKFIDHFADDAGCNSFEEYTRISAENESEASKEFCEFMFGTTYEILDIFKLK